MDINIPANTTMGLLFSGGLDSSILLGHLLREGLHVHPLFIQASLHWQDAELQAARQVVATIRSGNDAGQLHELTVLDLPLSDLYGNHWSVTGKNVPDAASPDEAVYLPGRNVLLIVKAALWCQLHGIPRLALGVLGSNPFPDATPEFFDQLEAVLSHGRECPLSLERPLAGLNKRQVMELGRGLPLQWTFSCISPIKGLHCGTCNKCAERQEAFRLVGADDPTEYAVLSPTSGTP